MALRPKHLTITLAVPLALGLAACSTSPESSPAGSTAEASAESAETGTPAETPRTDDEELVTDDSSTEATTLEVKAEGNGPIGLTTQSAIDADSGSVSGKLITGPGGCFSLVDNDRPRLVVFPDDASFVLAEGKPSVTTDALGTIDVGEQLSASAVTVGLDETTGIPGRCAQGAADEVLVVTGR
ncbi:hypothetical protein DFO66_104158 [Brevibacterium sanguinis]|uniref:DUF5666 domain-containing protein n=2 Tax=Brevibacterium TaxID=1696 RepID=A0A366IL97_9MICO|nr:MULTISPECIES: hypothetical protein [Brevibacterium]RBP65573.1 hypothetical protein DFO66_104158 [Brevibacterium sanguinis]RBP72207.1 hypothetical protein DFO65_104164 [Brevibacterium celere]